MRRSAPARSARKAAARLERTTVDVGSPDGQVVLRANGTVTLFDGFLKVYSESLDDGEDENEGEGEDEDEDEVTPAPTSQPSTGPSASPVASCGASGSLCRKKNECCSNKCKKEKESKLKKCR